MNRPHLPRPEAATRGLLLDLLLVVLLLAGVVLLCIFLTNAADWGVL